MAFTIGTQVGSLEITALLGKGGMGEVYRARDIRLKREVAIKILPEEFSHDSDRVARFQREAEVLASLNHPHIAGIHELGEANGSRFLVLELVEGETLAERIQRGAIPLDEALQLARSMCEALEAAHEKGVIHRDLKPANVKVTPEGTLKVLDFGLAKAMERAPVSGTLSQSPTISIAGTQAGMILGTAAYMSPEQAKGLNTDQRSDIFSFGAVFFEMVTGRQAFQGDSVSEVLASILAREPDLRLMAHGLNPKIYDLLRRALEKNPRRRWHAIGDLRVELEAVMAEPLAKPLEAAPAPPKPLWKRAVPVAVAVVLTAALTSAGMWYFTPSTPKPLTRFPVTLAEGQSFTNTARMNVAISPDGSQMVYVANQRLYHRAMSELEARPIPGTENWTSAQNPIFSPDGRSLAFFASSDQTLKKIALIGGASVTLCPADGLFGMSWGEDGIVYGQGPKGVLRVSENGGKPEVLVRMENGEVAQGPQVLPGGEAVLYSASTGAISTTDSWDKAKIYVQSLKPGSARQLLIDGGADARYVSTGHIVYAFGGTLFAVPFDLGRLQVTGGQVPVVEGVRRSTGGAGIAQFGFSNTGSLIYIPGPVSISGGAQITLATLDRQGGLERLKLPLKAYAFPRVSPDGKRVAVSTDEGKDSNVWIYDLTGATAPRQLTLGGANRYPVWSANGERVAFQSDREGDLGIFWQTANGTGTAERLTTKPEQGIAHIPDSWSRDGKALAYTALKGSEASVWIYSLQDKKASVFAEKAGAFIGRAAFSPDGQWLTYQSTETGTNQIFVQPFPGTGAKYPVARGGHPFWSPDGREILYNPAASQIGFVGISTRPTFSFGEPTILPLSGLRSRNPATDPRVWDLMPDGKKIIGTADASADPTTSGTPAAPQIQVVLNWFEDLKQRMSAK